ncbi:TonB-dependent receptor [Mucilaginibacter sp. PAMB04168]|uniref:SusC/RagA family TonB-linked outer membrane protein n=1 Tax=Mucilaginibacter sp. PAMB04168 TaxID=3138567 RepID=UPI0031F64A19
MKNFTLLKKAGSRTFQVLFLLLLLCTSRLTAQTNTPVPITGRITANSGEELVGVSIRIKNGSTATMTDVNGNFKIIAPDNVTLVVTYVGYVTQEVALAGRQNVNITLQNDNKALEDVVVVGYGVQRRANLTGSVGTVTGATLTERPAPNAANLLQGRIAGLQVTQPSAEPGRDNPGFLIRGRGSFNSGTNTQPLVLVDGVIGNMSVLSPDDIENVTVLKDAASASIYGARAANGVVLVTTKKGKKGTTTVSYRGNVSINVANALPDLITNSVDYMEMYRTAARRQGLPEIYTQARIDAYRNASDKNQYPNFDYLDYYIQPAVVNNHNISVSGGSDKSAFNVSASYLNQNGVLPNYKFKRYNTLLNYTNQISKAVSFGTSLNLAYRDRTDPPFTSENMMLLVLAAGPLYGPYLPDGSGRIAQRAYENEGRNRNPETVFNMGYQNTKEYNFNGQAYLDVKFLPNLTWSTKVAVNYVDEYYKMYQHGINTYLLQERGANGDYKFFDNGPPDILGVTDQYTKTISPTVYSTLTYQTTVAKDHNFKVLAGYEQLFNRYQTLRANRPNSAFPILEELSGYSPTNQTLFNTSPRLPGIPVNPSEWAMQSFFGRLNYNFKNKYLLEANLRYDGTSKVSPQYRWGAFPSVSAGWLVSEESFMRRFNWLTSFKVRGSYGVLGNQDVGTYLYQDNLVTDNIGYPFGNTALQQGAVISILRDQSLRWESTRIVDLGFDFEAWRGLLGITFDWFNKKTYNVLAQQPVPASLGLGAPTTNDGELQNRGVELELRHDNRIGQFTYGANVVFATAKNKLLKIRTPSTSGTSIRQVGLPYDAHYLYVWDGIFQVEDIGNPAVPRHALNPNPKAGDLKMKDLNGDNVVDANDRTVVDGAYADYTYSFGFHVGYKAFNLSTFFQGVQGLKNRVNNWGIDPFMQGTAPTEKWRNAWTPENRSQTLPALYIAGYTGVANYVGSTYYLMDASYLRMKNVTLTYTLPTDLIRKVGAKGASIYFSGENLFTITNYEGADPERLNGSVGGPSVTGNYAQYPQTRIYNFGINVKF